MPIKHSESIAVGIETKPVIIAIKAAGNVMGKRYATHNMYL